jgi:polyhydroxybutyrate depolymerase
LLLFGDYTRWCQDSEVILCTVEDGGHTWPGGRGYFILGIEIGSVTKDISAIDTMWEFFLNHPLE